MEYSIIHELNICMELCEVIVITKHGLLLMAQIVKSVARRSSLIMRDQEK